MHRFRSARWRHEHRRGIRRSLGIALSAVLVVGLGTAAVSAAVGSGFGEAKVGTNNGQGILLPTNQRIRPIGQRMLLKNGRIVSSSISPDGKYLAALSWNRFNGFLTMINVQTNKVVEEVGVKNTLGDGTVAADGPLWSADGRSLWFPQTADLVHFRVGSNGRVYHPVVINLQTSTANLNGGFTVTPDLPSGMALSSDGAKLYVALNGVNQLGIIDTARNKLIHVSKVGNAPRQVVLVGQRAYVSNEGGRPARRGEYTNNSAGTPLVANKVTGAASTGTVSVVNLISRKQTAQISVGLQPTAEYLAKDGTLLVANSNNDSVSMISTATSKVVQTINVNPLPGSTVGSYPNAITMPDSSTILVSIGRDNALAVYKYNGSRQPVKYVGLLPTDFYPVNAEYDAAIGKVVVTNDKGIGSRGPKGTVNEGPGTTPAASTVTGNNTYDDTASLTSFAMPSMSAIGTYTHQVFVNNDWEHLLAQQAAAQSNAAPVAIPAHLGDKSKIKHVFLIVTENRTYDQVKGDIAKSNGDRSLAQFGAKVTPNGHAYSTSYGNFDNFYDEGTLSADGHNWLMQADANDYIEKEFGAFYRSYPAQGGDALAYQRDGFLWNAAQAAGNTVKAYGEYNNFITQPSPTPSWSDYYRDSQIMEGKAAGPMPVPPSSVNTYSDIPSLNAIDDHQFPAFDLGIPDQYRTDIWKRSFQQSENTGQLANLQMLWMPVDHTSAVGTGNPNPVAQVADNDLAIGRIVDTISHSKFWDSSAIFVLPDDSQNGADHVDGHRAPLEIISPYAKKKIVDSTYYTQLNVVKTIEQILNIAPMNQEDRAATPMYDAFTNTADTTPYTVRKNQIPLAQGLTPAGPSGSSAATRLVPQNAAQLGVPASERAVYAKWIVWSHNGRFNSSKAIVDYANPEQLNRVTWYSAHNWKVPYPGDSKILAPNEVPGHNLPANYLGD